jgi:serine/threonine-protein kinase
VAYWKAGQLARAIPLHEHEFKVTRIKLGDDHPNTLISMNNLANVYHAAGQIDRAIPLHEQTLEWFRNTQGPDSLKTLIAMHNLATAYRDAGRHSEALPLFDRTLERSRAKYGDDHPLTLESMSNLARACLADKPDRAESLLREYLADRERKNPDDWRVFETRSLLGASLFFQKKYAEAESHLVHGYDGMKAREAKISARNSNAVVEAGARVVALYEASGRQEKAKQWRRRLGDRWLDLGFPADPFTR